MKDFFRLQLNVGHCKKGRGTTRLITICWELLTVEWGTWIKVFPVKVKIHLWPSSCLAPAVGDVCASWLIPDRSKPWRLRAWYHGHHMVVRQNLWNLLRGICSYACLSRSFLLEHLLISSQPGHFFANQWGNKKKILSIDCTLWDYWRYICSSVNWCIT